MSKKLFFNLILIFSYIYSLPGIAADKKEGQILFKDFNKDLVVDSPSLKSCNESTGGMESAVHFQTGHLHVSRSPQPVMKVEKELSHTTKKDDA